MPRLFILLPAVVLASLSAGFYSQGQAAEATDPPELRLSGTVIISEARRHAILEYRDGSSRKVVPGDHIAGWGRVVAITPEQVQLETVGGERAMVLSGGVNQVAAMADEAPEDEAAGHVQVTATPELYSEVKRLSRSATAIGDDLDGEVARLLGIPPSARIVALDHKPISRDGSSLRQLRLGLEQGGVRLSIGGGGDLQAIYLLPPASPGL